MFYAQEPDSCQKEHNGENRTAGKAAKENEYRDDGEVNGGGNNVGNNGGNNGGDNSEEYNTEEYSEEEYSQEEYSDEEYNEEEYSDEGEYSVGRRNRRGAAAFSIRRTADSGIFYSGYRFGRDICPAGDISVWTGELSENRYVPPVCPVLFRVSP